MACITLLEYEDNRKYTWGSFELYLHATVRNTQLEELLEDVISSILLPQATTSSFYFRIC